MSINPISNQQILVQRGTSAAAASLSGPQDASSAANIIQNTVANAQKSIANEVTTTNDDGTITINTAYTDGTTSTVTNANPPTQTVALKPLAANGGQLSILLQAQQQTGQGQA